MLFGYDEADDRQRSKTGVQLNCSQRSILLLFKHQPRMSSFIPRSGYLAYGSGIINIGKVRLPEPLTNNFPSPVSRPKTRPLRSIIILGLQYEATAIGENLNRGINAIKTDADLERGCVAAISFERIDNTMHTTPLEDQLAKYGNDVAIVMMINRN